ncbi:hypothetical protein RO21_04195 [[Actinobacillus] muris]|uniref:Urea transporter n=1 Tax=Muribacter muris TaxID=67855 RepID=A0A0J5P5S0_9PAST|nr:urea transporter [Muribacter muris]KMK51743.1 hypothetical protein RO21_04195 [[Actinobacillus] muris] [Muribacter muris]
MKMYKTIVYSLLRGISQIMLVNSAFVGLLFILGFSYGAWQIGLAALIGSGVGGLFAYVTKQDPNEIEQGLYGYNSALSAIAFVTFFNTPWWIAMVIAVALITVLLQQGLQPLFQRTKLPILTLPFILATWLMFIIHPYLPMVDGIILHSTPQTGTLLDAFFLPFDEVFLAANREGSLLIALGLLIGNWLYFLAAVIALSCAYLMTLISPEAHYLIAAGIYGFNAILIGIAFAAFFSLKRPLAWLGLIIAAMLSTWVIVGLDHLFAPLNLPSLTLPFVVIIWGVFLGKRLWKAN